MRHEIKTFPPPHEPGCILGHDGDLSEEEIVHLRGLGYVVANWRSFSGQKLVQAYFEGMAKNLIPFDDNQFRAIESMRKQLSKLELDSSDLRQKIKEEAQDVMSILATPFRGPEK